MEPMHSMGLPYEHPTKWLVIYKRPSKVLLRGEENSCQLIGRPSTDTPIYTYQDCLGWHWYFDGCALELKVLFDRGSSLNLSVLYSKA